DAYLDEAEGVLLDARELSIEAAFERAGAIAGPHPSRVPAAMMEARSELAAERASCFAARAFGEEDPVGQLAYALHTPAQACEPRDDTLTLDLTCQED